MVEANAQLFLCPGAPEHCRPLRITARGCLDRQARVAIGWRHGDSTDFSYSLAACEGCRTGKAVAKGRLPRSAKIVAITAAICVPSPTRRAFRKRLLRPQAGPEPDRGGRPRTQPEFCTECGKEPAVARGLCNACYSRHWRQEKRLQEALAAPQADHIVEPNKMVTPTEKPAPPAARPCDCGCGRPARKRSNYATRTCKILADRARYKERREAERRAALAS